MKYGRTLWESYTFGRRQGFDIGWGGPLSDINALAEVCEPGTIVIAAGQVNDVRLYRDLVASGIHDYLLKPFSVDQLRDSFAHAQMILSGPRGEAQADKPHVMAAVIGVRGGVGASTIATSLAWMLGERAHRTTALLVSRGSRRYLA
jgi:pilus assembly protein CpaE